MEESEIRSVIEKQHEYFITGATLPVSQRVAALRRIRDYIIKHTGELNAAIRKDLGKSASESFMCEVGLAQSEATFMIRHTAHFAAERTVRTPIVHFASRSFVKPVPYGTVLIMSPWNYPFLLTMDPLIDALAAGNTCIIKPSAYSPATTKAMSDMIAECFDPEYVAFVTGGRAENTALLKQRFDYIFFTGSQAVGREVLRQAAPNLTPVTLELGGKSPCVIDETANLRLAARRVVFGKYLNCGQTCIAPDYIYCHESIKDRFVAEVKREITRQFGSDPLENPDYGKMINEKHFARVSGLIDKSKIAAGGRTNPVTLQIEPTVMDGVTWDDAVMQEEIFGPLMPVLTFSSLEDLISLINSHSQPLAGYFFSADRKHIRLFTSKCQFGGGCINDTIIHIATSDMGFGGVGTSGMGAYHGLTGFSTFSHQKSIVDKKTWIDVPMRYQPYRPLYDRLIRTVLK